MSVITKQANTQLQQIDSNLLPVASTSQLAPILHAPKEMSLHDIFAILKRRKTTIILTLLITLTLALLYTFSIKPTYRANAMIQIEREGAEIVNFGSTQQTCRLGLFRK